MVPIIMFLCLAILLVGGVPIAASLGLAGMIGIEAGDLGIMAAPTNFYTSIAKYPLLAIPMFVLAGAILDRSGVAARLVRFASSLIGTGRGALAVINIVVAMFMGGISGSGLASTAALGGVMLGAMGRAGYPPAFSATVTAAGASLDILIPPSVAFIIYSVLVPSATVPALFAAGLVPGILAGLALIVPSLYLSIKNDWGRGVNLERPGIWQSFKEAFWALMAPVLILGGLRTGWFTPTEAAVVAVAYGLVVGFFIYRSLTLRDFYQLLVESAETSAVILVVVGLAGVFAWASSTMGIIDPIARAITSLGHEYFVLMAIVLFLVLVGMFLDGISIFLILLRCSPPLPCTSSGTWFGSAVS